MKKAALLIGVLLLAGCGKLGLGDGNIGVEEIQYGMPSGGVVEYEGHGKETWFAYGAVSGLEGGMPANGVAQAHRFEDGLHLATVQLNIEIPADGSFYEAWLQKGEEMVTLGHLSNPFGDVRHSVRFEAEEDYSSYLNVVVTLEKDDGNSAPGKRIAEGKLKPTERK